MINPTKFRPFMLLLLAVACTSPDAELIDRAEACAEQAVAWCEAIDDVPEGAKRAHCVRWYADQCTGPEPMFLADHDACMEILASLADHRAEPTVPLDCAELWPVRDGAP